jgi:hypothetical protein
MHAEILLLRREVALSAKNGVDRRQEIGGDFPLVDETLRSRFPGRSRDRGLVVCAQKDHLQSGRVFSQPPNQLADVPAGERQIHHCEARVKAMRAFAEGRFIRYHHHRLELRREKGTNPLRETMVRRRQEHG